RRPLVARPARHWHVTGDAPDGKPPARWQTTRPRLSTGAWTAAPRHREGSRSRARPHRSHASPLPEIFSAGAEGFETSLVRPLRSRAGSRPSPSRPGLRHRRQGNEGTVTTIRADEVVALVACVTVTSSVYTNPDWHGASATGSVAPEIVSTTHGPSWMPHASGEAGE